MVPTKYARDRQNQSEFVGLEDLLRDKNACLQPPKRVLQLNPEDVFIQSNQVKDDLFAQAVDALLLEALDSALNNIPPSRKKLMDMTEPELNSFISNANFQTQSKMDGTYTGNIQKFLRQIEPLKVNALSSETHAKLLLQQGCLSKRNIRAYLMGKL